MLLQEQTDSTNKSSANEICIELYSLCYISNFISLIYIHSLFIHSLNRKLFMRFCDNLLQSVPTMYVWCASMQQDVRPLCLEEVKMTTPLRSPPVVIRKLTETYKIKYEEVPDYTFHDVPVPTEGPTIRRIVHADTLGHTGEWPNDCVKCGYEVARVLTELNVGVASFVDVRSKLPLLPLLNINDVRCELTEIPLLTLKDMRSKLTQIPLLSIK